MQTGDGKLILNRGDVDAALAEAETRVVAEYYIPHLAQAPMEPPAAVADVRDGSCEVWACVQAPQVTRLRLAQRMELPEEDVTVNVTLLGGGFGRKSQARLRAGGRDPQPRDGAPVKLTWTREDDLHHSYYHNRLGRRAGGGVDAQGKAVAWLHRTAAPTIGSIFAPDPKEKLPFELGMG